MNGDGARPLLEKPAAGVPSREALQKCPPESAPSRESAQNSRQAKRQQMHRQKAVGMANRMRELGRDTRSQLCVATLASLLVAAANLCIAYSLNGGELASLAGESGNASASTNSTAGLAGNSTTAPLDDNLTGNATGAFSDPCQHRFASWFEVAGMVGFLEAIGLFVAIQSTTRIFMHEDTAKFIYHMREGSREAEALEEGVMEHAVKPLCMSAAGCCCSCCLTVFNMLWLFAGVCMTLLYGDGCRYEAAYFWAMFAASLATWEFSKWARRTIRD